MFFLFMQWQMKQVWKKIIASQRLGFGIISGLYSSKIPLFFLINDLLLFLVHTIELRTTNNTTKDSFCIR
jgi:hypothetical protein